jgi:Zn-dependent protease
VLTFVLTALLVAFSILAHELAHGYAALLEGDDTALRAGRLSWNPLRHVDPLLTIVLPLASWLLSGGLLVFGGAKPVPINPLRYRGGVRSELRVSLAGVAANAVIALVLSAPLVLYPHGIRTVLERVIVVNIALVVFNLLPIRPLDGWRVVRCVTRRG